MKEEKKYKKRVPCIRTSMLGTVQLKLHGSVLMAFSADTYTIVLLLDQQFGYCVPSIRQSRGAPPSCGYLVG
jgi:hypothetical protein